MEGHDLGLRRTKSGASHRELSQPLFPCTAATVSLDYSKEIKYGSKLCQREKERGKRVLLILIAKPFILHAPAKSDLSCKQITFLLFKSLSREMKGDVILAGAELPGGSARLRQLLFSILPQEREGKFWKLWARS